uniref:C-factor n=1 Tax=Ficedula albicollis TaxID=59894 RepID=A0A803VXY3_FICAL
MKGWWEGVLPPLQLPMGSQLMRSSYSQGLELRNWSLAGKRREDAPVLLSVLPTGEGASALPCAVSMCAPVPSVSTQAFLPLLKKAAQGSPGSGLSCSRAAMVNISSIGGSIGSFFAWDIVQATSYRCSKAALNMLSKCQSLAYKEHGILCVALHPGWVQTDLGAAAGHPVGIPWGQVHQSSCADFPWVGVAVLRPSPAWPIATGAAPCPGCWVFRFFLLSVPRLTPLSWVFRVFSFPLCPGAALSPGDRAPATPGPSAWPWAWFASPPLPPQPPTTVDDSVQGMLKVLSSLSEKDTGAFLDWEGKVIPW